MKLLLQQGSTAVESIEFEGKIGWDHNCGRKIIELPQLRDREFYPNCRIKVVVEFINEGIENESK